MPIPILPMGVDLNDLPDIATGSTAATSNDLIAAPSVARQLPLSMEDYAHLSAGADRFHIACEVFTLLYNAQGHSLLLSRVGSLLSADARAAMRTLRLRFLTFLHERPHADYLHITGVGGAQSLVLEAPPPAEPSLPRLRSEIASALMREEPCLLRTLGSLLSLDGRRTLQVAGMKLSKFIASDPCFVIHDNLVSFSPGGKQAFMTDREEVRAPAPQDDSGWLPFQSRAIRPDRALPIGAISAAALPIGAVSAAGHPIGPDRKGTGDLPRYADFGPAPLGAVPVGADWPVGARIFGGSLVEENHEDTFENWSYMSAPLGSWKLSL
jgi:hypothetical protein